VSGDAGQLRIRELAGMGASCGRVWADVNLIAEKFIEGGIDRIVSRGRVGDIAGRLEQRVGTWAVRNRLRTISAGLDTQNGANGPSCRFA